MMSNFANGYIDPEDISRRDMDAIADAIEDYLEVFTDVMIIPKGIDKDEVQDALHMCRKLVKKLRKGDKDVFKGIEA